MQMLRLGRYESITPGFARPYTPGFARVQNWAPRFARVSDREPGVRGYSVSSGGSYEASQRSHAIDTI
jgi:hypothetical protein